ncbi:MAG: class I SAM-dependent methyltransferase [Thioalkalispiraceae bacterium]|jgi:SAM-dependent methyltransferase
MLKFFGTSSIKTFVFDFFQRYKDLSGKVVIDIPAGDGHMSAFLKGVGADVRPFDLFPDFFKAEGIDCTEADLAEVLPIESNSADIVLCQEGLEHIPNQLFVLREFNRILKKNGKLIITVPNISHLRAKLSYFFTESDLLKRMPPNELDALWFENSGKVYFGHIFLLPIQKLRVLAVAAGFKIDKLHTVKASSSSLILGIFYPLIIILNLLTYFRNVLKNDGIPRSKKRKVYWEIVKLNMHPTILFGRHLFIEFSKESDLSEISMHVNVR